jgi:hypothetical protein
LKFFFCLFGFVSFTSLLFFRRFAFFASLSFRFAYEIYCFASNSVLVRSETNFASVSLSFALNRIQTAQPTVYPVVCRHVHPPVPWLGHICVNCKSTEKRIWLLNIVRYCDHYLT